MTISKGTPSHPGTHVRENIIPTGMSVTDAAKRLGIGRPALSNFLNGKASLSAKMAVRLEKTFGADRQQLLGLQTAYDIQSRRAGEREVAVRAFVPNFLTIKARQIESWADSQLDARSHLPVLLRKLIHSTGNDLQSVDFPGYDNAQRKGNDGIVEAGAATPWVPEGKSYWEFGTDQRPSVKANSDYAARLKSIDPAERASTTYVFVTPRNWTGKSDWEKQKNAVGDWKAVRVFDASDLEQWLEQSVPAQVWLADQIDLHVDGFETLEQAWLRWANASQPNLTPAIFAPSIAANQSRFKDWLEKPSEKPFVVAADSQDEALAFLACLFNDQELAKFKDLAAIFTSSQRLKTLVQSSVPFIPIVSSENAERSLADAHQRLHCIVLRPRNAVDREPEIALDLLSYDTFEHALKNMGIAEDEIPRLAMESGKSPTILRRRLSQNMAIKVPVWASDKEASRDLIPMALIGAWHSESEADREIISYVANQQYETTEQTLARLLLLDDSPAWSAGHYRGVTSKIDALFAVARAVTPADLNRFFEAAEYVLSETDPALDLPEKDRWAAALYGKKRDHSGALRNGICETLVILSVHGNNLFQKRLGIDIDARVGILVRALLAPLTLEKLLSQDHDLPQLAEAAPNTFLSIIEEDLQSDAPIVPSILKPVDSNSFGASPSRTGVLWALECLAWKPQNLSRVSLILAQLSLHKIDDNWTNKPEASLKAIFRSWMPQTAASSVQRCTVLKMLVRRYPDIGWEICIEQIKPGSRFGSSSYRPRWRSDASGAGQVVTRKEMYDFQRYALDLLLDWPNHDEKTLGDLVESFSSMPEEDQLKVWKLIEGWTQKTSEQAKAALRERIRRFAFTRRGRQRKLKEAVRDRAKETYDLLRPNDPIIRHGWLFAEHWLQESSDEIEDEDLDYDKRTVRVDRLRREAMAEIWAEKGFEGIKKLLVDSGAAGTIGHYVMPCVADIESMNVFVRCCLDITGDLRNKAEWCLQGLLPASEDELRAKLLMSATQKLSPEDTIRLLTCAPFNRTTWTLLGELGSEIRTGYWKGVAPCWERHTESELTEIIDQLLEVQRPRAAFHTVHYGFKDVETSRLKRLMTEVATVNNEPTDHYKLNRYYISEALISLDGRPGVTRDDMAQLEFLFIDALDDSKHGIPNLEKQIAESPALFVQAIALAYKRSDEGEDPPEWRVDNPEQRTAMARSAYSLLDQIKTIPGATDGRINVDVLSDWITEVRRLCRECARADIGDQRIGQLLSKSPAGENEIWPCEPVCEVMEDVASPEIARGFNTGVYNSRGVHTRVEGGSQERELAAKYRAWAEQFRFEYPYVGSVLESIAQNYDREAGWHDTEADISKRLR